MRWGRLSHACLPDRGATAPPPRRARCTCGCLADCNRDQARNIFGAQAARNARSSPRMTTQRPPTPRARACNAVRPPPRPRARPRPPPPPPPSRRARARPPVVHLAHDGAEVCKLCLLHQVAHRHAGRRQVVPLCRRLDAAAQRGAPQAGLMEGPSVCACVSVCVCVCVCKSVCARVCVCVHVRAHATHKHVWVRMCVSVRVYVHACVRDCVHGEGGVWMPRLELHTAAVHSCAHSCRQAGCVCVLVAARPANV